MTAATTHYLDGEYEFMKNNYHEIPVYGFIEYIKARNSFILSIIQEGLYKKSAYLASPKSKWFKRKNRHFTVKQSHKFEEHYMSRFKGISKQLEHNELRFTGEIQLHCMTAKKVKKFLRTDKGFLVGVYSLDNDYYVVEFVLRSNEKTNRNAKVNPLEREWHETLADSNIFTSGYFDIVKKR